MLDYRKNKSNWQNNKQYSGLNFGIQHCPADIKALKVLISSGRMMEVTKEWDILRVSHLMLRVAHVQHRSGSRQGSDTDNVTVVTPVYHWLEIIINYQDDDNHWENDSIDCLRTVILSCNRTLRNLTDKKTLLMQHQCPEGFFFWLNVLYVSQSLFFSMSIDSFVLFVHLTKKKKVSALSTH